MPSLTFNSIPLCHDFNMEADGFLERYQRLDDAVLNGEFGPARTWQTNPMDEVNIGLPIVNWPKPPPLRLNQLYWPCTGASRWAEGVFLCNGETKNKIDTCANASAGAYLQWDTDSPAKMDSLLGEPFRYSKWLMFPLAFRRVAGCRLPNDASSSYDPDGILSSSDSNAFDLYLVHLVDERYWWQFIDAPDICSYLSTWTEFSPTGVGLIDYLLSRLAISNTPWAVQDADALFPAAYATGPHPSEWTRPYHNAAQLLDAALECAGARLVANPDMRLVSWPSGSPSGFEIQRYAGAEASFQQNISANPVGLGTPDETVITDLVDQIAGTVCSEAYASAMPAYVNVVFPKSRYGMLCSQCGRITPGDSSGLTEEDCYETYYPITHALGEYLDSTIHCPVSSTAKTIHVRGWADMGPCTTDSSGTVTEDAVPMNAIELIALANQISQDWFMYHRRQYDFTTVGPTAWQPCGYDDCIIHRFGTEFEDGQTGVATTPSGSSTTSEVVFRQNYRRDITSRIQSLPLNVGVDCQLHNTNALELSAATLAKIPDGGIEPSVFECVDPSTWTQDECEEWLDDHEIAHAGLSLTALRQLIVSTDCPVIGTLCDAYRVVGDISCGPLKTQPVLSRNAANLDEPYQILVYNLSDECIRTGTCGIKPQQYGTTTGGCNLIDILPLDCCAWKAICCQQTATSIIRFKIISIDPFIGESSSNCLTVLGEVLDVSCGGAGVEIGDEVVIWDRSGCKFNVPADILVGMNGNAVKMEWSDGVNGISECVGELHSGTGWVEGECWWSILDLCCGEDVWY